MGTNTFIIPFTSLSIILLCFFIFLNSKHEISTERERSVLYSVAQQFSLVKPVKETPVTGLTLESQEFFLPHSSTIRAKVLPKLRDVVMAALASHNDIEISGRVCFDAPKTNDYLERQRLALERGASLLRYLVDEGVNASHVIAKNSACPDPSSEREPAKGDVFTVAAVDWR